MKQKLKPSLIFLFVFLFSLNTAFPQTTSSFNRLFSEQKKSILDAVNINAKYLAVDDNQAIFEVIANISIPEGNHIYSTNPGSGLTPVSITFESADIIPVGKIKESAPIQLFDFAINKNIYAHKKNFELMRRFKTKQTPPDSNIPMTLKFQICNQKICSLPLSKNFNAIYIN